MNCAMQHLEYNRQYLLIVQGIIIMWTWTHAIARGIIIRLIPCHYKMDLVSRVERDVIRVKVSLLEAL